MTKSYNKEIRCDKVQREIKPQYRKRLQEGH